MMSAFAGYLAAMDTGGGGPLPRPSGGPQRVSRRGSGRPKASACQPGLRSTCARILEGNSADSPTDPVVVWTHLKPMQLAAELVRRGFWVGRNAGVRLLEAAGCRRRALRKELSTGRVDPLARDCQFRHIDALRRQAQAAGKPLLCVDTKKKELVGYMHRSGQCCGAAVQHVYDHNFRHLGEGLLVLHGAFDDFNHRAS